MWKQITRLFTGHELAGFNVLEWLGMLALLVVVIYGALAIRDMLSGKMKSRAPRTARSRELPRTESVKGDVPKADGEETILIIDDDAAVLRAHARLVSKLGYKVERALGGAAAVDFVRGNHADLIILDLLMPEMDGMETFREIKRINPYQRAIVLSGFAGPAMVNAIKSLGVGSYLVKPAQVSILAKAIREELDREDDF